MSEKARRKRLMRLRGEKRVKKDKSKGLPPGVTPLFRIPGMYTNYYAGRDPTSLIAENDKWLGRWALSDENLETAGAGLQMIKEVTDGREPDRDETKPARSPDPIAGDELEEREVQSRAGDNTALDKEGTAPSKPAVD